MLRLRSIRVTKDDRVGFVRRLRAAAADDRFWFGALMAVAVTARLYHFSQPPDDAHEWRQTQTLMYAASYAHGAGLLTPHSNWNGIPSRIAVLELPVYSVLVHWLSGAMGLLTAARLLSFLFSVATLFVFDRLCAALGHPMRRTATLLLAFAPVAVFYGHATQPESLLLLLVLAVAYCAVRSTNSRWWTVGAAVLLAVASTIKPTALLVLAPPLVYLAWKEGGWVRQGAVLGAAALAVVGWAGYVRAVLLSDDPTWYRVATDPSWLWGPLSLRFEPEFYAILLSRLLVILLPPAAAVLILLAARKRVGHPFWWWWCAGSVAAVLVFARLNEYHFYYELPYIPGVAALAAYGVPRWPRRLATRLLVASCLVLASAAASLGLYREQPVYLEAGLALAKVSSPGQPVIAMSGQGAPWLPTVLYYADRDGWNLPLDAGAGQIAALPGPTPCWLVVVHDQPGSVTVPDGWLEKTRTADYVLAENPACSGSTGS